MWIDDEWVDMQDHGASLSWVEVIDLMGEDSLAADYAREQIERSFEEE